MATMSTPTSNGNSAARRLLLIPIGKVSVQDGFNPRGEVADDAQLDALVQTIRDRGLLQPILVRGGENDGYVLVAGERRYRAALKAKLTEIPASVLPAAAGEDARLERLTDAVIENELRSDLNPLQRAGAYRAMLDQGATIRGLAERLGGSTRRGSRERRIREHLQILQLPEDLQALIAAEQVPLLAVKALLELCEIHPDLARVAVKSVLEPGEQDEPYTWAEIADEALAVAVRNSESLPDGIFQTYERYPLSRFTLSEKTTKQLAVFEKLTGRPLSEASFTPPLIEAVRPLGVVHDIEGWSKIIVGQDVGDRLAEDYIAAQVKTARENAKRREELQGATPHGEPAGEPSQHEPQAEPESVEQREQRQAQEAKLKREQDKQARQEAISFNRQLGVLVFKHLARVKVDERVMRILLAVDFGAHLRGIAARGARLALPGWPEHQSTATGRTKTVYLEIDDAQRKAHQFLTAGEATGEIAGRALTLIALAELADQQAIAMSKRTFDTVTFCGPYAVHAERDLYALIAERIKKGQLPALDRLLAERVKQSVQRTLREPASDAAAERVAG